MGHPERVSHSSVVPAVERELITVGNLLLALLVADLMRREV
jgi:hypothetical protein